MSKSKEINYALYETTRPPMYTAMKYWGKKPHNIWSEYINNYTITSDIYLDPFSGSAMSALESLIIGRKTIAFDLNPLTSFIIEVFTSEFDSKIFLKRVDQIVEKVKNDYHYQKLFLYREGYTVHNVKYEEGKPYEIALVSLTGERKTIMPDKIDSESIKESAGYKIKGKYPNKKFQKSISFTQSFLNNIGKTYDKLYTNRNLYVLSSIFNEILKEKNSHIQKQLLFTFIKIVHLSSKMAVPRGKKANRDFSTSWGRPAYIYSKKQMEMNPLLLFENASRGKQSTNNALLNFNKRIKKNVKTYKVQSNMSNDVNEIFENVDLIYGKVDIKNLSNVISHKSVKFLLTDPPYGGLIQYLDLSSIWLSWLEIYDDFYLPNYDEEIIVNGTKSIEDFEKDMTLALKNMRKVLKDDGKIVLTFNNKDLQTWKALLKSIELSGLKIEKVIHQQNRRTGESNVSDPFGSSASDFYIRCIKSDQLYLKEVTKNELDSIMLKITEDIIRERNEPTPYQILFNGVLANMSLYDIDYKDVDNDFNKFLEQYKDIVFTTTDNKSNKAGNYWWLKNVKFDVNNEKNLTNRVNKYILKLYNNTDKVLEKTLYEKIYKMFPNGLTPDPITLGKIINKLTLKKGNYRFRRD